jgi:hypothetical protein
MITEGDPWYFLPVICLALACAAIILFEGLFNHAD